MRKINGKQGANMITFAPTRQTWMTKIRPILKLAVLLLVTAQLSSCGLFIKRKQFVYWQDAMITEATKAGSTVIDTAAEKRKDSIAMANLVIRPFDILDIKITQGTESFTNLLEQSTKGLSSAAALGGSIGGNAYFSGSMVDKEGNISIPIVGTIQVAGKSMAEIKELVKVRLMEYLKEPYVDVKLLQFKVTMLGAIKTPGVIYVNNERATVLDAIALSGDLALDARIDNVKVLRGDLKNPTIYELDMRTVKMFTAPGFQLQPNDILYVEPSKRRFSLANLSSVTLLLGLLNVGLIIFSLLRR